MAHVPLLAINWLGGGTPVVLSQNGEHLSFALPGRPLATGTISRDADNNLGVTVNFPDDNTYTGTVSTNGDRISWSNNSFWTSNGFIHHGGHGHVVVPQGGTHPSQQLDQFTVTAMVKSTGTGRIWDKITAGGNDGWLLDLYPGLRPRIIASPSLCFNGTKDITAEEWTYLAFTFSGHEAILYVNGVRDQLATEAADLVQNTFPFRVGFDSNGQNVFPGTIQHARLYTRCLTDQEVHADYEHAHAQVSK